MTCRGRLPDGNPCDAEDRHTAPATGLCGSCGAPESVALVPMGSMDLMADPEVTALHEALPPQAQAFFRGYVETLTVDGGAEVSGGHRTTHYYRLEETPKQPIKDAQRWGPINALHPSST